MLKSRLDNDSQKLKNLKSNLDKGGIEITTLQTSVLNLEKENLDLRMEIEKSQNQVQNLISKMVEIK